MSETSARDDSGVVLNAGVINLSATEARREELRAQRAWDKPPIVSWDDIGTTRALDTLE